MSEWLTHVFVAYALFTVGSWRLDWLGKRWVAVAVVGSILPDLNRLRLLVAPDLISAPLGVPFDWDGLHTLAGIVLLSGIGALLFERRRERRRAFGLLIAGALSHIVVDIPQRYADGQTLTNLYAHPLPPWRVSTPGWYVPADRWVVLVAFAAALVVFVLDRYWMQPSGSA